MSNNRSENITTYHNLIQEIRPEGLLAGGSFFIDKDGFIRRVLGASVKLYNPFEIYQTAKPKSADQPHLRFLLLAKASEDKILSFYNQFGELGIINYLPVKEQEKRVQEVFKLKKDLEETTILVTMELVTKFRYEAERMRILAYIIKYLEDGENFKLRNLLKDSTPQLLKDLTPQHSYRHKLMIMSVNLDLKKQSKNPLIYPKKSRYLPTGWKNYTDLIANTDEANIPFMGKYFIDINFSFFLKDIIPTVKLSENNQLEAIWRYNSLLSALYLMLWLDLERKTLSFGVCKRPDCEEGLFIRTGRKLNYCSDRCAKMMATRKWRKKKG